MMHHLVLAQSTFVTDGQTDRIMTPKTALAYARAVKMITSEAIQLSSSSFCVYLSSANPLIIFHMSVKIIRGPPSHVVVR